METSLSIASYSLHPKPNDIHGSGPVPMLILDTQQIWGKIKLSLNIRLAECNTHLWTESHYYFPISPFHFGLQRKGISFLSLELLKRQEETVYERTDDTAGLGHLPRE